MVTYKINTNNKTNNVSKLIAQNQAKQNGTTSTTPKQTVQIKNPTTGSNMTVTSGSQTHKNYLKNNPSAIDQSSVKTTYSTPDKYNSSDNVKTFDQNGQQTSSSSGYTGATTPTFNVSSSITDMINQIKNQEALMRQTWASADKTGYNDLIADRNKLSGQLLNLITQESGGNATLGEIESILGRRLENQEMDSFREKFSTNQTQLNNLWEHDFATRNNGEHYQYLTNYLTNGTGGEVLSETMRNYLDTMSPADKESYTQNIANSLSSTQNYFDQRSTGWTPEYVNNEASLLPFNLADLLGNGGFDLQQLLDLLKPNPTTPQIQAPVNLNVTNTSQAPAMDYTALMNLLNTEQTPSQSISPQGNLSTQSTQDDVLNRYLMNIWNGGL